MAGRRRPYSGRPRRRRAKQVKVPTNMYVADTTFDVSSFAALTNNLFTIFDNSGTAGNKTVMFTKLTVSWGYFGKDLIPVLMSVGRQKEGGIALDMDEDNAVRDYINDGHSLRGVWMQGTLPASVDQTVTTFHKWKTMVFKKLMLDANDDLVLYYTPLVAQTSTEFVHLYYKGFFRIVD